MNWAKLAEEALAGFDLSALPPTVELPALPHAVTLAVLDGQEPDQSLGDGEADRGHVHLSLAEVMGRRGSMS